MSKSVKKLSEPGGGKKKAKKITQKSASVGRTAQEIVKKHIRDKNDVITEEDFKNLKIEIDITKDTAHQPLQIPDDKERPKDEDKDPKIITPWDVISDD